MFFQRKTLPEEKGINSLTQKVIFLILLCSGSFQYLGGTRIYGNISLITTDVRRVKRRGVAFKRLSGLS